MNPSPDPQAPAWSSNFFIRCLQQFSDYIRKKTLQLFRYRVILAGLLLFCTPIWVMDQGQDLLINSNSTNAGVIFFMTVVLIAAFLHWYLAKLFFEKEFHPPVYPFSEPTLADKSRLQKEKKVSRYLGICTIIIPAAAVLHALSVIKIPYALDFLPAAVWLMLLGSIYFFLGKFEVAEKLYGWLAIKWTPGKASRAALFTILLLAWLIPASIWLLLLGKTSNTPASLIFLFWHLVCLSFCFYLFVSLRNFLFPGNGWLGSRIGWPVILGSGFMCLLFLLLNCFPLAILSLDCNFLSLPVLLAGLIFYMLFFTLIIRIGLWARINLVFFIVAAGLLISIFASNSYHTVARQPAKTHHLQPALNDYFRQWLLQRKDEFGKPTDTFPVFLVNTYGGGIRAASFTNMVFSWLDSTLIRNSYHKKGFEHYVFSVSGASGGTIGAAVQCAYRAKYLDGDCSKYSLDSFENFYQHDFLTPVLGNLLGRDVWASVTSLSPWEDRSAVQENLWAGFGNSSLHISLDQDFDAIWDTSISNPARYEVPLLFSNTLNIDDGLKGILAPIALDSSDFPGVVLLRPRIDALNALANHEPPKCVSLITGAFLSARFPFISPSGKLGNGYHFMDGGAKDNSGASTSEDIFISLAKAGCRDYCDIRDSTFCNLLKRVRFYFVSITNSPYYNPDDRKLVSNIFEPISPIVGIINSGITGNAQCADNTIRSRYSGDTVQFRGIHSEYSSVWITATSIKDDKGAPYSPILPLGWQISKPSLLRMRRSFSPDMLNDYNAIGIPRIVNILAGR